MTLCVLAVVGCSRRTHDAPSSSMEPKDLSVHSTR